MHNYTLVRIEMFFFMFKGCEVVSLAAKDASCDSADDVCSRSTAIRSKSQGHPAAVANPPKKNRKRKRKRKREPSSSSAAIIPTTEDCKPVCVAAAELPEDPLPRGRRDLLRGGAQQNSETRTKHLRTEQRVSPVTDERGSPIESGENELNVKERESIARELGEGSMKKVKVCRSVLRVRSSLPWGSSSVRWWLRRAQHKCEFNCERADLAVSAGWFFSIQALHIYPGAAHTAMLYAFLNIHFNTIFKLAHTAIHFA